jgi:hypothetical protein
MVKSTTSLRCMLSLLTCPPPLLGVSSHSLSCYAGQTPGYPRNTFGQALLFTQEDRHNNKRPLFLIYPDASRPLCWNTKSDRDCAHDREQKETEACMSHDRNDDHRLVRSGNFNGRVHGRLFDSEGDASKTRRAGERKKLGVSLTHKSQGIAESLHQCSVSC